MVRLALQDKIFALTKEVAPIYPALRKKGGKFNIDSAIKGVRVADWSWLIRYCLWYSLLLNINRKESIMARLPRLSLPDVPQHVVQRGNNRQACFFYEPGYTVYLHKIKEYSQNFTWLATILSYPSRVICSGQDYRTYIDTPLTNPSSGVRKWRDLAIKHL